MLNFTLGLICGILLALFIDGEHRPPKILREEIMLTTCIIIAAWTTGMPLWA